MEILNYALVAIVISIGLILGRVLAWIAKEEIRPGKNYFLILQKALFCAAVIALMFLNRTNVHYIWAGALIIFVYVYYYKKISPEIVYGVLGLVFYLSSKTEYFLLASSLIFLYGLPSGTLLKNKEKIALNLLVFLVVSIGLFLLLK
jgi:hypothetical protein